MKQSVLDERQEQVLAKVGALSFYVMFFVCTAVIIVELLYKGSLENVIGETIVFAAGGVTCLVGSLKNGIWTKNSSHMTVGQNLLGSVICSGIFSIFYAFLINRKASESVNILKYVGIFFVGIAVVCFIVLCIMGKIAQVRKENEENRYSE